MMAKAAQLPADIQWHFIGNLQTNKVKYVVPIATLIHSVSNTRLIQEINKVAAKNSIISKILLEIHVANEETKQGFTPEELTDLITPQFIESYPNIQFCGVMGMASYTENQEQIRKEFTTIAQTFNTLKQNTFKDKPYFKEISMGMSGDYTIAIQQGATMVRIGSTIFGQRDY